MTVSIQAGIVGFEVSSAELYQVLRDFVGAKLDEQAREALRNMIAEVNKDFRLVVDVLTPLYAINSTADLRLRWPEVFQRFKREFFTQWGSLGTSCGIVTDHLQRLRKAHNWKRRVPLLRNAAARLDDLGQRWMCNDSMLYQAMQGFMQSVNQALSEVNALHKTPEKALRKLQDVLHGTEGGLLKIKAYSNELQRISEQLFSPGRT